MGKWQRDLLLALAGAIVGGVISALATLWIANQQIDAARQDSRAQISAAARQVNLSLDADRAGRASERRAAAYAAFADAVDRHLDSLGQRGEGPVRSTDLEVIAALRRVQLLGSQGAFDSASAIAARTRRLTNADLNRPRSDSVGQLSQASFAAQQRALDEFIKRVQPELRR